MSSDFPLVDAKTGPKYVLLSDAPQDLVRGHAKTVSEEWVFSGNKRDEPLSTNELYLVWGKTRDTAGIVADAQLHDLRNAHTLHAFMNGNSLHVAGHRQASTTNCYVNLDDNIPRPAAELIAAAFRSKLQRSTE